MDFHPKEEPVSPLPLASVVVANDTAYMNMSISDLISKLRDAEAGKAQLHGEVEKQEREIHSLNERLKFETLEKKRVEEELKRQSKKGKEAEERYERLLEVLRTQNRELKKLLEAPMKPEEEQENAIAKLRSLICKRKFVDVEANERVSRSGNDVDQLVNSGGETDGIHVHGGEFVDISAGIEQSSSDMAGHSNFSLIHSGPEDLTLLYLNRKHIAEATWQGYPTRTLNTRRCDDTPKFYPPAQLLPYLRRAGFYGAALSGFFPVDNALISALVERWRPETHTFHMPIGEVTITLQDVAVQMGLPVDGEAVVGRTNLDWPELCENLLGRRPPPNTLKFQRLSLKWLQQRFTQIPANSTNEQLEQYTRAYILMLIGGVLMGDKSSTFVHLMYLSLLEDLDIAGRYSWGAAVLAHLYRELCTATDFTRSEFGGCVQLLHMWAWDRFPRIAPTIRGRHQGRLSEDEERQQLPLPPPLGFRWSDYRGLSESPQHMIEYFRDIFDNLEDNEVVWQPYYNPNRQAEIPAYCLVGSHIWQSHVPLICFHIIEWHQPDRVLRQFGMDQSIPQMPVDLDWEHTQTLKGKTELNWVEEHQSYIELWDQRHMRVSTSIPLYAHVNFKKSEYMMWYKRVTRRWINPKNAKIYASANAFGRIYEMSCCQPRRSDISQFCLDMMQALGTVEQLQGGEIHIAPPAQPMMVISGRVGKYRSRAAGFRKVRQDIIPLHDDCPVGLSTTSPCTAGPSTTGPSTACAGTVGLSSTGPST